LANVFSFVIICIPLNFKDKLKEIDQLGAALEEALILDNVYTEHSTVGLAQQWDQLEQLGMRMQHNLEQQIQARYAILAFYVVEIILF